MMRKEKIKEVVEFLKKRNWSIGVVESCTGGAMMDSITNIPGVSEVFFGGRVVYSDRDKIEAGIDKTVLEKYGVYSEPMAREMARVAEGNVGVGITGNLPGRVFVAVRFVEMVKSEVLEVTSKNENKIEARIKMKQMVVKKVYEILDQLADLFG